MTSAGDPIGQDYWHAVLERLGKTFVQCLVAAAGVALIAITTSGATSAWEVQWWMVLGNAVLAAVLSLLTSLASTKFGRSRGPSLVGEVLAAEARPPAGRHARPDLEGDR